LLSRADGSVRFSQGRTSVIVAVYGPIQVQARKEKIDRATVQVVFKSIYGQKTPFESEKASLIRQSLESIILVTQHPRTLISIIIQVVHDDGSLVAASITGAWIALVDAGIQCKANLCSVSICALGVIKNKPAQKEEETGARYVEWRYLIDPTKEEENNSHCTTSFAFDSNGGLVMSDTRGIFSSPFVLEDFEVKKAELMEVDSKQDTSGGKDAIETPVVEEDSEKIYFDCQLRASHCCKYVFDFVTKSFKERLQVLL